MKLRLACIENSQDLYEVSNQHPGDAGLNLISRESIELLPGQTARIRFGIVAAPQDPLQSYWLIPRSKISKTPLRMSNSIGLIDAGYRGELMAAVDNASDRTYDIQRGTSLFQLVAPDCRPLELEWTTRQNLSETERGDGGFGSTDAGH